MSLDLNGAWTLGWFDGQRGEVPAPFGPEAEGLLEATVPGDVHLDLWRAGLIANPYQGLGALQTRWVEEYLWYYRREFDAPPAGSRAWLVFERLDYTAAIFINGEKIAVHKNFFRPCRVEVTQHLQPGRNLVAVEVESGLFDVADKPATGFGIASHRHVELTKRHWLRKPNFQFTWDWSTRLVNVGVSGDVRLEWTSAPVRLDRVVVLARTADDLHSATVTVRAFVEGLTESSVICALSGSIAGGPADSRTLDVQPGLHSYDVVLHVPEPDLWWPVGTGPQALSEVTATLTLGDTLIGTEMRRVGFRTVRFDESPDPAGGSRFVLHVNGRPIFCKGANWVPADMILQAIDQERYAGLIDLALEANFNFLRIWGGGLYEAHDFYDLCDEKGILVWQEFNYACSRYPAHDPGFYEEAKLEARHQVRRLAHHASLIAWCGNNEIEEGYWHWGFDKGTVFPDHSLYHLVLPRILSEEDGTHYYQPTSPWSRDGSDPRNPLVGDQHPWTVGFANGDFRDYRTFPSRFPNEGGIQGPTALPTMRECLAGGPETVGSFAWRIHDNSNGPHADNLMRLWLGLEPTSLTVEEYTYWGGLLQGEGLREYIENFRRRMFSSSCAAFWMYNDCWPATRSWTIVDYRLRRTPSFSPVRRAFEPVTVVVAEEDDSVKVFGVNETSAVVSGRLRYGLVTTSGQFPMDLSANVSLAPNASTLLAEFPTQDWSDDKLIAFAQLTDGGHLQGRSRLILPLYHELDWVESDVNVSVEDGEAVFRSSVFTWGVCLDLDGENPLPDNFFDVWPGIEYRIPWTSSEPPVVLAVGNELPKMHARHGKVAPR